MHNQSRSQQAIDKLKPFYSSMTDRQKQYFNEWQRLGSMAKAAKELGISAGTIKNSMRRILKRAARYNDVIESHTDLITKNPSLNGISDMQLNEHDKPIWLKFKSQACDQIRLLNHVKEGFKAELTPAAPVTPPQTVNSKLLTQYTITDFHLGMLADAEETGGKWNIKIAEQMLIDWFAATMAECPDSEHAVYAQIGDFLHWDGLKAVTPGHGHVLDADSRYQKLIRSCIRVTRTVIGMLLSKHKHVHIIFAEGNHDESGSSWMREMLDVFYEDEPRITVDTSIDPYYGYQFGKVGLFFHHSHKKKFESLPPVFAGKFREIMFGSEFCYGHTGHYHHKKSLEFEFMEMRQHRTLAAPDAHASSGGWLSQRGAVAITYHSEYGYMGEVFKTPYMLGYEDAPRMIYTAKVAS